MSTKQYFGTGPGYLTLDDSGEVVVSASLTMSDAQANSIGNSIGAALAGTVATQTTLAAINTKAPALGQALAAASVPVVLTAAQITTLTPPSVASLALESGGNLATVAAAETGLATAHIPADYRTGVATGTGAVLIAANTARKKAIITNMGTAVLWVALGGAAYAGKGIPLNPPATPGLAGDFTEVDGRDYTGAIWGITSDTTANNIAVAEA